MSASTAPSRVPRIPASRRPAPDPGPQLQVVTPPVAERRRLPFVIGCTALMVASLLGLLVLNISLSRGAYVVHDLQERSTALAEREQHLSEELAARAAPAQLSGEARRLGMVPAGAPAFIRLSDGKILGTPRPAPSVPAPSVVVGRAPATKPATPKPATPKPPAKPAVTKPATAGPGSSTEPKAGPRTEPKPQRPVGDGAVLVAPPAGQGSP